MYGIDIYPVDFRNSVQAYLAHIIDKQSINCVWDIGANIGQYASMLRNIGFQGDIFSFEPIPSVWTELQKNAEGDLRWRIYDRCAIGLIEKTAVLNITADLVSSSLLRPIDSSTILQTIDVQVVRLDSIIKKTKPSSRTLLKLDCQGGEYDIILSAEDSIRLFSYVQLEASIYPLYAEERGFFDLVKLMDSLGFDLAFLSPGIVDKHGRMVQVELFFKRR